MNGGLPRSRFRNWPAWSRWGLVLLSAAFALAGALSVSPRRGHPPAPVAAAGGQEPAAAGGQEPAAAGGQEPAAAGGQEPAAAGGQVSAPDLAQYRRIVARVRDGENYYRVYNEDLKAHGYHYGSVFNYRTPLQPWFLSLFPRVDGGRYFLVALCLAGAMGTYGVLVEEVPRLLAGAGAILATGALLWCVDGDAFLAQEPWASALILLSVLCYARDLRSAGMALGLLALFVRELAAVYVGLAFLFAIVQGRRAEMALWTAGFLLYGVYFALHAQAAARVIGADAPGGLATWLRLGGIGFVVDTAKMNQFLFRAPRWLLAGYLSASLLGLWGRLAPGATLAALTAVMYLAAFCLVGQPSNDYWGLLYSPLLPLGIAWTLPACRDLVLPAAGGSGPGAA